MVWSLRWLRGVFRFVVVVDNIAYHSYLLLVLLLTTSCESYLPCLYAKKKSQRISEKPKTEKSYRTLIYWTWSRLRYQWLKSRNLYWTLLVLALLTFPRQNVDIEFDLYDVCIYSKVCIMLQSNVEL